MRIPLDALRFARVAARPQGMFAVFEAGNAPRPSQSWDVASGARVLAHAELFEGRDQWGVKLYDTAPEFDESELLKITSHLLVWHAGCRADTVDVVLARTRASHVLVRVGGDYV